MWCCENHEWSPLLLSLFLSLVGTAATIAAATALGAICTSASRALGGGTATDIVKHTRLHCILQPLKEFFLCHAFLHIRWRHTTTSLSWTCSLSAIRLGGYTSVDMKSWFVGVGWTSHPLHKKFRIMHFYFQHGGIEWAQGSACGWFMQRDSISNF